MVLDLDDGAGGLILTKSISVEKNGFAVGTYFIFRENKMVPDPACRPGLRILLEAFPRIITLGVFLGKSNSFSLRESFSWGPKCSCRVEEKKFLLSCLEGNA